jgi:hypothetical protein
LIPIFDPPRATALGLITPLLILALIACAIEDARRQPPLEALPAFRA